MPFRDLFLGPIPVAVRFGVAAPAVGDVLDKARAFAVAGAFDGGVHGLRDG